jgi:1-deoxy-D-xylulose-5-phosphate reductoisomerase
LESVRTVSVMGSTGSIGTQTLEVLANDDRFRASVLAAHSDVDTLVAQAAVFRPDVVVIGRTELAGELRRRVDASVEVLAGAAELGPAAAGADICVNGVVGFAGLDVTLDVLSSGKRLALANKESLIAGGPVVQRVRSTPGAEIVPVDSEHCALHQCLLAQGSDAAVARLVLTASGGPFRGRSAADLATVTVADALAHPTWAMGPKITVDSSTLMNKGLEVIEAHELFGIDYDRIEVVVHPQSIVHSMVEFPDGSTIAQLSRPDMRLPIAYALCFPERSPHPVGALDFGGSTTLEFQPPDRDTFRCLDLAFAAGRAGGTAPAWLSAANEVAVDAFLTGRLGWSDIAAVNAGALDRWDGAPAETRDDVLAADAGGRRVAAELCAVAA